MIIICCLWRSAVLILVWPIPHFSRICITLLLYLMMEIRWCDQRQSWFVVLNSQLQSTLIIHNIIANHCKITSNFKSRATSIREPSLITVWGNKHGGGGKTCLDPTRGGGGKTLHLLDGSNISHMFFLSYLLVTVYVKKTLVCSILGSYNMQLCFLLSQ